MKLCETCRYWDRRYPENQQLGVCRIMGILLWPKEGEDMEASVNTGSYPDPDNPPTSDVIAVRTVATFGCIHHKP